MPTDKILRRVAFRGLDALITNSRIVALELKSHRLTEAPVEIVLNGVEIRDRITNEEYETLRAELRCSSNELLIGTIGRLDSNKNHAMAVRVLAKLVRKGHNAKLVIIGDGPLKNQLLSLATTLGIAEKIYLPGERPCAARYLPVMDICCFTSYAEGMPNVIMEASAASVPVVATTCGGSSELIEEGTTGFLVPVNEDGCMVRQVEMLIVDTKVRCCMGRAGRQKMIREFSVETMVCRMAHIYKRLLRSKANEISHKHGRVDADN